MKQIIYVLSITLALASTPLFMVQSQTSTIKEISGANTFEVGLRPLTCSTCKDTFDVKQHCQEKRICVPCAPTQCFQPSRACDILCSTGHYNCGSTLFLPRSTGDNTAREMVGFNPYIYHYFPNENYVEIALATEYSRSFRGCRIAQALFCTDCLTFTGSQAPGRRNGSDVIADYFGLAPDFRGSLRIKPHIENYIIDINLFIGLEEWFPGLFLRVNAPITHTRWNLGLSECIACDNLPTGTSMASFDAGTFPPGYMQSVPAADTQATPDNTATSLRQALSGEFLFGDMQTPWKFGRFSFCPRDKIRVADVDVMIGIDFFNGYWFNNAIYAKLVVPVGNRLKAKYIFEPLIGNARHWELGGGFAAHYTLFGDPCHTYNTLGIYFDGNVTYVFKNHQKRMFDFFHNGFFSRYLLLKEFEEDGVTYANNLINGINFTTRDARIEVGAKGDASAMLLYRNDSWMLSLGYNVYGRQGEKVCIETQCPCDIDRRKFGIKGIEGVYANIYTVTDGTFGPLVETVPLNSTESNATAFQAATTDNPEAVPLPSPNTIAVTALSAQAAGSSTMGSMVVQAEDSNLPVLISCKDLDPNSAAVNSVLTHKVFGHLEYVWFDSSWQPHIGIGGEVEFDGLRPHIQSLNQWGVWIKGGLSY